MKNNSFEKVSGKGKKIAVVQARFNSNITNGLRHGALKALEKAGVRIDNVEIFNVPGAVEIPIVCQRISQTKKFDGIVALGAVIRGETDHYEYIARATTDGIMNVMLKEDIPIAFGVITTNNLEQAEERSGENDDNKGYEAVMSLLEVLSLNID